MHWSARDTANGRLVVLVLPRQQLKSKEAHEDWRAAASRAQKVEHPHLARLLEFGVHEHWPFAAFEAGDGPSLEDLVQDKKSPLDVVELAETAARLCDALATAHEAGMAHGDLQAHAVVRTAQGQMVLVGLGVLAAEQLRATLRRQGKAGQDPGMTDMEVVRSSARNDLVALGVVLYNALAVESALDEVDVSKVLDRIEPHGREWIRLSSASPRKIPEPLRIIINRAIDRRDSQRFKSAKTFQVALEGWLQAHGAAEQGPLSLVQARIHRFGLIPASQAAVDRLSNVVSMEREHVNGIAEVLSDDLALTMEALRVANLARTVEGQSRAGGSILSVRRCISMLGLEGVRRLTERVKLWPGELNPVHSDTLATVMQQSQAAVQVALAVRPAGYEAELVQVVTQLQVLGRLVLAHLLPDEYAQIRRLAWPHTVPGDEERVTPLGEQTAAYGVLGVGLEELGLSVAHFLGLGEDALHMLRRIPTSVLVHPPTSDDDTLRLVGSCANDAIDALNLAPQQAAAALASTVQRYGHVLKFGTKTLRDVLLLIGLPEEVDRWWTRPRPGAAGLVMDEEAW